MTQFLRRPATARPSSTASARAGRAARLAPLALALGLALASPAQAQGPAQPARPAAPAPVPATAPRTADFIVAVINRELVSNAEVQARAAQLEVNARGTGRVPPREELLKQALDQLIDERAQLTHAREIGMRLDDNEIDRGVASVAQQNQITVPQLKERLKKEGFDYERFRRNVRDQMLLERVRDREVADRVRITDAEIDAWIAREATTRQTDATWEIAQLLVAVPDAADAAQRAALKAKAEAALARARAGEDFDALVKALSDGPKERGGSLGPRPVDRLPDAFIEAVRPLSAGQVAATLVSSGAGFHVLRLVEAPATGLNVTQHRARHILLRPGPNLSQGDAAARLAQIKREIESGQRRFEDVAKVVSQDGSAPQGGDLGWAAPGQFVPEFEQVMKALRPGEISEPVPSRFGVHLIKLEERRTVPMSTREQRELARNALREQKYDAAYEEWATEVRDRAYVERREAPL